MTAAEPFRRARLGLGYVPQGREIFPGLTVYDNLRMGCSKQAGAEHDTIATVLEEFPRLKPLLDRPGGALSGGEQQLLAIARCLCGKPRLVLLDEPTEGIQPSIIDEIVEVLQRLRDYSGLTMILVEQNLDFIAALSKRILIIQKGTITQRSARRAILATQVLSENLSESPRKLDSASSDHRETDHGSQKTHSRSIAQRSRGSRYAHG